MDQAAGLRRMLATPQPRRITILSAMDSPWRNLMLDNLCAGFAHAGCMCLLVDARRHPRMGAHLGLVRKPALVDVLKGGKPASQAIHALDSGYAFAALHGGHYLAGRQGSLDERLCDLFDVLSQRYDSLIVDAELDEKDELPVSALENSRLVVHVGPDAESIKQAYALVKRLATSLGRRRFDVLVSGTEEARARLIYANLARTASRYLAVTLQDMGSVPPDEHVGRAARLGRPVIDAYPLAQASVAIRRIAGQLSIS